MGHFVLHLFTYPKPKKGVKTIQFSTKNGIFFYETKLGFSVLVVNSMIQIEARGYLTVQTKSK